MCDMSRMWSRQQMIADFHLYTCLTEEVDAPVESVILYVTRSFISERKYLQSLDHEENDDYDVLENGGEIQCSTDINEASLKVELKSDQKKLANRLSTIALGDFDLSSDSDASEGGTLQETKESNERLKKFLDNTSSIKGIHEEMPNITPQENVADKDWETTDNSALMEAMGLPLRFGNGRSKKSKHQKNKLTEKEIRKEFSSLWDQHGELMVYKSFVSIYPDFADYYDEITGSIPPCIEIEITDDTSQYSVGIDRSSDFMEDDNENVSPASKESAIESPLESHLTHGGGDTILDINYMSSEKTFEKEGEIKFGEVSSNEPHVSDCGDIYVDNVSLAKFANDGQDSKDVKSCKKHYHFKTQSLNTNEHDYSINENSLNTDHCYIGNENSTFYNDSNIDDTTHLIDDNETYSYDELITLLKSTHEDLKNQIYWHVKEKVSAWYQEHPNQKFNVPSLDEDLIAIAWPYVEQWKKGDPFCADYVSQGEDVDDEEELVDGLQSGEKMNNSLEALGLTILKDNEKRESRKRKFTKGIIMVRQKNIVKESKKSKIDFGRQRHDEPDTAGSAMPAPRHFVYDDDDIPHEVEVQSEFIRDIEDTYVNQFSKVQEGSQDTTATILHPTLKNSPPHSPTTWQVEFCNTSSTQLNNGVEVSHSFKCSSSKAIRTKKNDESLKDYVHEDIFKTDPSLKKYWAQRYRLFSKFDLGIQIDREGWFSVTPEPIAVHTAKRCQCDVIIDAFCGVGGNSIQFAQTCNKVIAIDIDSTRLSLARHNANIYGVRDRIEFIEGDFLQLANSLRADVVFLSPPWGGPSYLNKDSYDLDDMAGFNSASLVDLARKITKNVAFYLPRNSDVNQIAPLAGKEGKIEVEQNILDNKVKLMTAYLGDLIQEAAKIKYEK